MTPKASPKAPDAPTEGEVVATFRGNFSHSIDDKGRVSLPVDFRRNLETRTETSVVLTNYISEGSRCLEGFSIRTWEAFEKKLREKSRFSAKLQRLENFYLEPCRRMSFRQ